MLSCAQKLTTESWPT